MNKPILLALTGFRGCGKDFIWNNFLRDLKISSKNLFGENIFRLKRFAFADLLKLYCERIYGFTREEIEEYKREDDRFFIAGKELYTMREILVNTANSLREISDDAIWAKLTIEYINKFLKNYPFIIPVITDLRFLTELEFLNENFNTILIYLENDCEECQKNYGNEDELEILDLKDKADIQFKLPCLKLEHDSKNDSKEILKYKSKFQNQIKERIEYERI